MEYQNPDYQKALELAQTPAAQKLLQLLRQNGGTSLDQAMQQAKNGDFSRIKAILQQLAEDPQAGRLLKELGNSNG